MGSPRGSNALPTMGRPLGPGGSFKLDGLPFHFRRRGSAGRTPNFARRLRDEAQFGLLVGLGQQVALQCGRKAALRAQGESFEGNKPLSGMDARLELALALQGALFRADQTQHNSPVAGDMAERFETTGAFIIELEQESLEFRMAKDLRDRGVIARSVELALVVPPAQVEAKQDSGVAANHRVIHLDGEIKQTVGIIPSLPVTFANLGIDQRSVLG